MADTSAYPDVLDPLRKIAEVAELPARQELLLERIGGFHGFLTPLEVQSNREVLDRAENLIISPHIGGATVESQSLIYQFMIQKMVHFFSDPSVVGKH